MYNQPAFFSASAFSPNECLIFLNGVRDKLPLVQVSSMHSYRYVVAVDGAWNDLQDTSLAEYVNVRLGDGDSILSHGTCFIHDSDQDTTDFEKSLLWLIEKGVKTADVCWGSGGEMDHFLGNLSVAAKYRDCIKLRFYDEKTCYFLLETDITIDDGRGKTLSIYPFPQAIMGSQGLAYELSDYSLDLTQQQSLRNRMIEQTVSLTLQGGLVFVFIGCDFGD